MALCVINSWYLLIFSFSTVTSTAIIGKRVLILKEVLRDAEHAKSAHQSCSQINSLRRINWGTLDRDWCDISARCSRECSGGRRHYRLCLASSGAGPSEFIWIIA